MDELREILREHNYRYYVLDDPIVSDRQYDMWMRELEELEARYPQYITPRFPYPEGGGRTGIRVRGCTPRYPHAEPIQRVQRTGAAGL